MNAAIDFWFDFYSPYAYLASLRINEIAAHHGRTVVWRPFLLGPLFQTMGLRPLVETPLLADYARHDFERCAQEQGVPFTMPEGFPKAALAASRAFYWMQDQDPTLAHLFAGRVFRAIWAEGLDGTDIDTLAALAEPLGVKADTFREAVSDPAVKARLKSEVEAAIAAGVCGAPFFIVDGEPFWGNDRLAQMTRWLERNSGPASVPQDPEKG